MKNIATGDVIACKVVPKSLLVKPNQREKMAQVRKLSQVTLQTERFTRIAPSTKNLPQMLLSFRDI
jgi:hypothetical protein